MIDFRPRHARLRDDWIRWSLAWMLGSASTFSFLLAIAGDHYAVYIGIAGVWLTVLPMFALAFVMLTLRPVVAYHDGLDVEGELVLWRNCSAPKRAFFSPGRAWITVWTRTGYRDIQLVGNIDQLAQLRRLADTFGPCPSIRLPLSTRAPKSAKARESGTSLM